MRVLLKCLFAAPVIILAAAHAASAHGTRAYRSPDRKLVAVVTNTKPKGYGRGESVVKIRAASGALIARKDLTSPDGQQGLLAGRAAWSPDGQFFVFSTGSTGGHQPWHAPTYFYSRLRGQIYSLDALVGSVTSALFRLKAPATLETEILVFDDQSSPLSVDLRTLGTAKGHRPRMH